MMKTRNKEEFVFLIKKLNLCIMEYSLLFISNLVKFGREDSRGNDWPK